jgi:hypothetical protein
MFRYVKVTSDGVTIVDNKTEVTGLHIGPSLITSPVSSVLLSTIVTLSDVTFTYLNI